MSRIWYQSLTELPSLPRYAAALAQTVEDLTPDGVRVEVHGMAEGTYGASTPVEVQRYPRAARLVSDQVVANAETAEREGFDAFVIASFVGHGLGLARASVDIPVLNMAEECILASRRAAKAVRYVCLNGIQRRLSEDLLDEVGLAALPIELRTVDLQDETDLDAAIDDPAELIARFESSCSDMNESLARTDFIIPAEGILAMALLRAGVTSSAAAPIMNVFDVTLKATIGAAQLYRSGSVRTARTFSYPKL